MGHYYIKTTDGEPSQEGTILRLGKGRKAIDVLGIARGTFIITHIPTGYALSPQYQYQSQARAIADSIISLVGESLINNHLQPEAIPAPMWIYINMWWGSYKNPPSYEEFLDGPDYQAALEHEANSLSLANGETQKDKRELLSGGETIAWLPHRDGAMRGEELECLVEGRPTRS